MIDSLETRLKMLRAEAASMWKRLRAHEAKHDCHRWVFDWRTGSLAYHPERSCPIALLLTKIWCDLVDAAVLPSPDARLYQDALPEWTEPVAAEGAVANG